MVFDKEKNYLLVEIDHALVILDDITAKPPTVSHQPLLIADAGTLLTYLDRYFFEREHGATLAEAHDRAMKTAKITKILPFRKKGFDA